MLTHLTLMPVCLVKAASAACGRESAASATVIVTPDVLSDAAELPPPLLPPPQAASARASAAAPVTVWPSRPRLLRRVLANAPLLRYAAIAGSGAGAASWHMRSRLRDQMLICVQAVQVACRTGILQSRLRPRQAFRNSLSAQLAIICA